jgi:hypothetical protein
MKNWKTIVTGSLYPLAKWLQNYQNGPHWFYAVGQVLEIVAVFGLGIVAKDYDKTGYNDDKK